jgi:dTDP-4-amino-4,6-dideoxygalactose transaminase
MVSVKTTGRNIPFSPPDITSEEIAEVAHTLQSGWITTGPKTKEFERRIAEYVGTSRAACLNSATAAMEMTLRVLGVGPGDEVITTAYTYTATAAVIHHVGAKIVLIDVAPSSYEMDYKKMEEAITERTKAIIAVDIAGKMCDYDSIYQAIENKKELYRPSNPIQETLARPIVIADSAHGFGASMQGLNSGEVADFTCFSFHAVKNLTTAEGGAVTWRSDLGLCDEWIYNQYMLLSLHGQSKDALAKTQKGSWEYDVILPAYKCNMTDIMASIGLVQLKRYEAIKSKRRQIIELYSQNLLGSGIETMEHYGLNYASSGHLYFVRIPDMNETNRNEVITKMAEFGIACNVHYKPLPMMSAYKALGFDIEDFPNAYDMYKNEITLPLHTLLTEEDVKYVTNTLIRIIKESKINV